MDYATMWIEYRNKEPWTAYICVCGYGRALKGVWGKVVCGSCGNVITDVVG